MENIFNVDKVWNMAHYIVTIWCLILYNAYKPFKKIKKFDHINFTSILSANNGKFNDIRAREELSRKLNVNYSLIPYLSNICLADIVHNEKKYNKCMKKHTNIIENKTKISKKTSKKKRHIRMKNIYCQTNLFKYIRENNLNKKSIERLCTLSKCDTLWSDNQIIREFVDTIDNIDNL